MSSRRSDSPTGHPARHEAFRADASTASTEVRNPAPPTRGLAAPRAAVVVVDATRAAVVVVDTAAAVVVLVAIAAVVVVLGVESVEAV